MDGYAVRAADVAGGASDAPGRLPVGGDVRGRRRPAPAAGSRHGCRIMTGAPLPAGADAVVPVEWTDGWSTATPSPACAAGSARRRRLVRRAGEDVARAARWSLPAGTVLGPPRSSALLAAVGRDRCAVHRAPAGRRAVQRQRARASPAGRWAPGRSTTATATGSPPPPRRRGAAAYRVGSCRTTPAPCATRCRRPADRADLVLTSGGVSAGAYDTVKEVLAGLGTVRFEQGRHAAGHAAGLRRHRPARRSSRCRATR